MTYQVRPVRVRIRVLTFQVSCDACGAVDWVAATPYALSWFAAIHRLPTLDQVELLVDDVYRVVPVTVTR